MGTNIAIGIGGTGARCIESLLHVAGSGLVRPHMKVAIVDQDENNGNSAHSLAVAGELERFTSEAPQGVEAILSLALPCRIEPAQSNPLAPLRDAQSHRDLADPASLRRPNVDGSMFYHALYNPYESQTMTNGGFYANPYIGNSCLNIQELSNRPNEASFWNQIDQITSGTEVRVLLMGSIFGGTGAAILPAIAERLHSQRNAARRLHVGVVLMLPYFSVEAVAPDATSGPMSDRRVALALRHYSQNLMAPENRVIERAYLLGHDLPFRVRGAITPGGGEQLNEAMFPELLAGLAAADFFADSDDQFGEERTAVRMAGRADADKIGWDDLPKLTVGKLQPREELLKHLLISVAYLSAVYPYLRDHETFSSMRATHRWFRSHFSDDFDFLAVKARAQAFARIAARRLVWFGQISRHPAEDNHANLVEDGEDFRRICGRLRVSDPEMSPEEGRKLFDRCLPNTCKLHKIVRHLALLRPLSGGGVDELIGGLSTVVERHARGSQ